MIYYIQAIEGSPIKIGFTKGPIEYRLRALQGGSPLKLTIIAWEDGDMVRERELHDRFDHLRLHGEWFRYAGTLIEYIVGETNLYWVNHPKYGAASNW